MKKIFLSILLCFGLASCDHGVEWSEGDYVVHWIDTTENLTLARKIDSKTSIGRVRAEVIAIGSNENYIIAKQKNPSTNSISYFYINKKKDGKYLNLEEITEGPFSKSRFMELQKELGLPKFTKEFKKIG